MGSRGRDANTEEAQDDMAVVTMKIDDVRFDKNYYTRTESQSPAKVQEYALSIAGGAFPPLLVNQDHYLLDGWHRWKACQMAKVPTCEVEVFDTTDLDVHTIRRKAAGANARHGHPQTEAELKKLIRDEYRAKLDELDQAGREALKQAMAADYSRSPRYVQEVTSRIDRDLKQELRETAFQRWLACDSQEEIAQQIGYSRPAVNEFLDVLQNVRKRTGAVSDISSENGPLVHGELFQGLPVADDDEEEDTGSLGVYRFDPRALIRAQHLDEHFTPPLYNIWKQQERSAGQGHFGNSEITWLDNLLYLYTQPFDIVIDPFAGSGSTIDLCKMRLRRYLVSDRKPVDIRSDIRPHDVTTGVLAPPSWKPVKLVYLDPPYWKQAEGQYSSDPTDLANMPLETFTQTLARLVKRYGEKLRRAGVPQAYIALLLQPTQWKAPEHQYTDHVADLLRLVKLPLDMRMSCPYETQQHTPQMVEWAKTQKHVLVLTRELIVWRLV